MSRTRNGTTSTQTMPTLLERGGDFSQSIGAQGPVTIFDPLTGSPFPGNVIPTNRLNPTSLGLLKYYPTPNAPGYKQNYQAPITTISNSDNINSRLNQTISKKDRLSGGIGYMGSNSTTPNIFNFIDTGTGAQHQRERCLEPQFQHPHHQQPALHLQPLAQSPHALLCQSGKRGRRTGHHRHLASPAELGPAHPFLHQLLRTERWSLFPDPQPDQRPRRQHHLGPRRSQHDLRRRLPPPADSTARADPNARGQFTFTGASTADLVNGVASAGTGFDFASFLLGRPDTSALRYGNSNLYFRTAAYDVYMTDDWRIDPEVLHQLRHPLGLPESRSPSCTTAW